MKRRRCHIAAAVAPAGFTLLEVLLSLAIFVGSAAALSRLVILGIDNAQYADWQARAMVLAESRWAELEAGILDITDVGTYPAPESADWEWTLNAQGDAIAGLYRVELVVRNVSAGPARGFTLRLKRLWFDDGGATGGAQATTATGSRTP